MFPAQHSGAGTMMFGPDFVAKLHPNARKTGVEMNIVISNGERLFGKIRGLVMCAVIKVDFGHGVKRVKIFRLQRESLLQFVDGALMFAHGKIKGGVVNQVACPFIH